MVTSHLIRCEPNIGIVCEALVGPGCQDYKEAQAVPALKPIAGLRHARVAHHRVCSPDTGSYSGERQMTKEKKACLNTSSV